MAPHTRALVAAAAFAFITGKKVAGVYDHSLGKNLRIAAECRGDQLQGFDGDRLAGFGGQLPEIYDDGDKVFISLEIADGSVRGYDRGSACSYVAKVTDQQVQVYDHGASAWFAFDIQTAA
jgi:hypothetical protein